MKRILALLAVLALAATAWAANYGYSSGVTGKAISQTNTTITFTDNHSGGSSAAFAARYLMIRPRTGSDTCHVDLMDGTATTADTVVPAEGVFTRTWDDREGLGGGFKTIGAICGTGETATWDVDAWR